MSTKTTTVKKASASKAKQIESAPVVQVAAPVPAPVVVQAAVPVVIQAPAPVVQAAATAEPEVKAKKTRAKKAVVAAAPVDVPAVEAAPVALATQQAAPAEADVEKRVRPKLRAFNDIYSELSTSVSESYNLLQNAKRGLKSLQSAHNREVHNTTKTRESATRTPTIVFDQQLVNYFRKRLPVSLLKVTRKGQECDLSDLNTETRVHRTDVTQLYTAVFKHHKMQNPDDRRNVLYMQDPDLLTLLTSGDLSDDLDEDVKAIRDGSYKLTIFNIQRFTNQHLGKVAMPAREAEESVTA